MYHADKGTLSAVVAVEKLYFAGINYVDNLPAKTGGRVVG
jgi:hypothetical protein